MEAKVGAGVNTTAEEKKAPTVFHIHVPKGMRKEDGEKKDGSKETKERAKEVKSEDSQETVVHSQKGNDRQNHKQDAAASQDNPQVMRQGVTGEGDQPVPTNEAAGGGAEASNPKTPGKGNKGSNNYPSPKKIPRGERTPEPTQESSKKSKTALS